MCVYIYIKSCIICQQCCHVLSDASDIVMSFDVGSVAISHQQHCHALFDASNVVMCHLMPLKKQKQILGGEKLCSGKRSLVAMVTRTQIAVDKCCHSIHILCISSWYVVILFISCVSLHGMLSFYSYPVYLHHMLSFYSYPVYLFMVCCHSIHILCISSWYVVILFISCVALRHLSFCSDPMCLYIICVECYVAFHHFVTLFISDMSHYIPVIL